MLKTLMSIARTVMDGHRCFMPPVRYGHTHVVHLLIDNVANIHSTDDYGAAPLHCACSNGSADIVVLLLEKGANVRRRTLDGETVPAHIPMMFSVFCSTGEPMSTAKTTTETLLSTSPLGTQLRLP